MKRKQFVILISVIMVIFLAVACGSPAEPETQPLAQPSQTVSAENEVKLPGGEMFISMPAEAASLDPLEAQSEDMVNLLSLIYETPLKYNADGSLGENTVASWSVEADNSTFTFVLRDDVYFSDGTKLTSEDIVFSANRVLALDGTTVSGSAEQGDGTEEPESGEEESGAQDDEETGADEETPEEVGGTESVDGAPIAAAGNRYAQYNSRISNIEATDALTVRLTMNEPGNAGLHFMTFPVMNEAASAQSLPVGTGAYMVESYTAGERMVLTRNDGWWKGGAYIDRIVANAVADQVQALEYVESSIIDFTTTDVLYAGNYKQPGQTQVIDYMTNYYDCLVPNLLVGKMQDVNVRQAISYGIDRREILSTVLLNHGVPTNMPIAPDFFAYESKYKISDYDHGMAKEFMQAAGYRTEPEEDGSTLTLDLLVLDERTAPYKKEAAKAIKKQLGELGIEVNIVEKIQEEYEEALQNGNFDLAYCSYYMHITPDLSFMFDPQGEGNVGHVSSAEIDTAIAACKGAVLEEDTQAAYSELQRVLAERVPQIGLYFRTHSIVCDETIRGITNTRQNMVFNDIAEWYQYMAAQQDAVASVAPAAQESALPEETAEEDELTALEEDAALSGAPEEIQ